MGKIFVINTGSASKKYALYSGNKEIFSAHFEKEFDNLIVGIKFNSQKEEKIVISPKTYDFSVNFALSLLLSKKIISDKKDIAAVGIRIVAPGNYFLKNRFIDKDYLIKLHEAKPRAPLHIAPALAELEQLRKSLLHAKIFGISDSAFHAGMPEVSRRYSLPRKIAEKFKICRYGYHGISAASVLIKVKDLMKKNSSNIIICHLGSGISITAVKNGESIDTSMGFTPLEGLPMRTRIGNIDSGAVIYLAQKSKMPLEKLEDFFNKECGLLGLSGKTGDIRELLKLEKNGDSKAKLALEVFVYHVKKYIGAYKAVLGGLDLLVFAAAIGERSFIMRSRICKDLGHLGILLDGQKNKKVFAENKLINSAQSPVKIAVIAINEMEEMAKETKKLF